MNPVNTKIAEEATSFYNNVLKASTVRALSLLNDTDTADLHSAFIFKLQHYADVYSMPQISEISRKLNTLLKTEQRKLAEAYYQVLSNPNERDQMADDALFNACLLLRHHKPHLTQQEYNALLPILKELSLENGSNSSTPLGQEAGTPSSPVSASSSSPRRESSAFELPVKMKMALVEYVSSGLSPRSVNSGPGTPRSTGYPAHFFANSPILGAPATPRGTGPINALASPERARGRSNSAPAMLCIKK